MFHGNINRAGAAGGWHHKSTMRKGEILHIIDPLDANGELVKLLLMKVK